MITGGPGVHVARTHAAHANTEPVVRPGDNLLFVVIPLAARAGQELRLLGMLERVELGSRATQPDLLPGRVDEIDRHQTTHPVPAPWLDDEVGERLGDRIDEHTAEHAADAVTTRDIASDRELRAVVHSVPPIRGFPLRRRTQLLPKPQDCCRRLRRSAAGAAEEAGGGSRQRRRR
jgi:hypothetical protein